MCGRYATTTSRASLLSAFSISSEDADEELPADYNVAPTKLSAVVIERVEGKGSGDEPIRQLRDLRFGLLPNY